MSGFWGGGGGGASVTTVTLTSSNIVAGIYSISGVKVVVQVRESNGYVVVPDNILQSTPNTYVYLSSASFGTVIQGNWAVDYL